MTTEKIRVTPEGAVRMKTNLRGQRPVYQPCDACGLGSRRAREAAGRLRLALLTRGALEPDRESGETVEDLHREEERIRRAKVAGGLKGKELSPWSRDMGPVVRRRGEVA